LKRIKALVLGSGNIGTDLALRMASDERFEVLGLVGRRDDSPGLIRVRSESIPGYGNGLKAALSESIEFDVLFDATSALDHAHHWMMISDAKKLVIDLTPSRIGVPMVPILIDEHENFQISDSSDHSNNYSMITCGGQSSAAVVFSFYESSDLISEVEVSSSISAKSAGMATRRNVDQYIDATEKLASLISGCVDTKAILVLNPAEPPVMMRTTVTVRAQNLDLDEANRTLIKMEQAMRKFVPGYRVVVPIHSLGSDIFSATVLIEGAGFYLPKFSGNLDVINAAAVETAIKYFEKKKEA
jgi:acetaldehyde dehydrogenase